jgi:hypothetical protein
VVIVSCGCDGGKSQRTQTGAPVHCVLGTEHKGMGSSDEVHAVDALAITGDEGRASLRKAWGSWHETVIPRCPNGETRPFWVIPD